MISIFILYMNVVHADIPEVTTGIRYNFKTIPTTFSTIQLEQGFRLRTDIQWEEFAVHAAIADTRVWGSEITYMLSKDTQANLYEGYIHLPFGNDNHWIQIGRQEFVLNNGRYLWDGAWNVYGRSFDGIHIHGEQKNLNWSLAGFVWKNSAEYTDPENEDKAIQSQGDVLGVGSVKWNWMEHMVEPYVLYLYQDPIESDLTRKRRLYTSGLRVHGNFNSIFYDIQGMYQFGQHQIGIQQKAWMGTAKLGMQIAQSKFALYFEQNSGDNTTDDKVNSNPETFAGRLHGLRGWADMIGDVNSRDMAVQFSTPAHKKLDIIIHNHMFQLSDPEGNWYTFNNKIQGEGIVGNTDPNIGYEFDSVFNYKPYKGLQCKFGYSLFIPTGTVGKTYSEVRHFPYIWLVLDR